VIGSRDPRTGLGPRVALACALAAADALAQGGPPMLTDDPDTPGDGHWEINAAYVDSAAPGSRLRSLPHVDVNYGLGDRLQLKYETGFVLREAATGGRRTGLDDGLIGVKWRFLDQSDAGASVSTYPQYQVVNSRSAVARGLASDGPNLFLPIEASRTVGRGAVVGELGYQFMHAERSYCVYGVLGALPVAEGFEALAEGRRFAPALTRGGHTLLDIGFRARLSDRATAIGSIGKSVASGPDSPSWTAYLGVQLVFAPGRH
jgi:hypothetical protein